jgi:hypothetical protein
MSCRCETHGGRKQLQLAVLAFVEKVKSELGIKALHRELEQVDGTYALRESGEAYRGQINSKNEALTSENTISWERITKLAAT